MKNRAEKHIKENIFALFLNAFFHFLLLHRILKFPYIFYRLLYIRIASFKKREEGNHFLIFYNIKKIKNFIYFYFYLFYLLRKSQEA